MTHEADARATRIERRAPINTVARVSAGACEAADASVARRGRVRAALAALERTAPELVRDGGTISGPALCRVSRAWNGVRVPGLATAFWRSHPKIAPAAVDFGLSAGAFDLGADASLAPDVLLDVGPRRSSPKHEQRQSDGPTQVWSSTGGSWLASPDVVSAAARRAARRAAKKRDGLALHPTLVADASRASGAAAVEAAARLDLSAYRQRKARASARRAEPHHGPSHHAAASAAAQRTWEMISSPNFKSLVSRSNFGFFMIIWWLILSDQYLEDIIYFDKSFIIRLS